MEETDGRAVVGCTHFCSSFTTHPPLPPRLPLFRAGAVANAVLDVIQGEGLQAHAAEVGAVLLDGFARLAGRHDCVGSARGVGLMVGLEILHPLTPEQKADAGCALRLPWTSAASAVVYAMKERGFLL